MLYAIRMWCAMPPRSSFIPQYNKIMKLKQYETFNLDLQYHTILYVHLWKLWTLKNMSHPLLTLSEKGSWAQFSVDSQPATVSLGGEQVCYSWWWLITTNFIQTEGTNQCNQPTLIFSVSEDLGCDIQGKLRESGGYAANDFAHCSTDCTDGDTHLCLHRTEDVFLNWDVCMEMLPRCCEMMMIDDIMVDTWDTCELMEFLWQMIQMWNTNRVLFPSKYPYKEHMNKIRFCQQEMHCLNL